MRKFTIAVILCFLAVPLRAAEIPCAATDKTCLLAHLEQMTGSISEEPWRDQTYRELAKLLVHEKEPERAIALVPLIESPDKRAMTIRAIGIEAATVGYDAAAYEQIFAALRSEADKIEHAPSHAIALNYIADAQALAGDDENALKTAMEITNTEMRNKALYDSAKIQAEEGRIDAAITGIKAMGDPGFENKAYFAVMKIRAEAGDYDGALKVAENITNNYQRAQAVLTILARQITPDEVSLIK